MKFDITKIDLNNPKTLKWIALAFLAVVLIIDLWLILPLLGNIGQAKLQRDKNAAALTFFKGLVSAKEKLTKTRIIDQQEIDGLLDKIQLAADQNNVEAKIGVSVVADPKDKGQDPYAQKDLSLTASGAFKDLGVFLTALRNMPDAVLDIASIRIAGSKTDVSGVQAQINLVVLTTKDNASP